MNRSGVLFRRSLVLVVATAAACSGVVTAGPVIPVVDVGFEASDVSELLTSALTPFVIVALSVGFGYFVVFKGVRYMKRLLS